MEELIFFGVIILFSILESVARTKKARKAAEEQGGEGWQESMVDDGPPVYDPETFYDEDDDDDRGESLPQYTSRYGSDGAAAVSGPSRQAPAPDSLLPSDLFQELAGLAGRLEAAKAQASGFSPQPSLQLPRPEPESPRDEPSRAVVIRGEAASSPSRPEHRVHLQHAGYGTDPSERARSEQDGLDPLAEHLGADASAVRAQLMSHSFHALRQAVVMQEVLGPPAALRRDRFET